VAATFASTFTVFGVTYSFGAFFDSMAEDFGTGKSATALMFSITTAWYFGIGPISGKAVDRFGPRPVLAVAAVCLGAGLFATAQVESIWLGYVTYALGVGTAVACAYVPMVATVGGWFVRHRTTALGIAVAGIGAGTIAVAPIAQAVFIKSYATDRGISSGAAASLVGIIGASSIVGRLGLGALGSRLGPVRLMQVSVAIMGASFVLWLTAGSSFVALVVFTIVIGVGYGGYIALSPAATAVLFGTVGLGAVLGAVYTGAAVGGLVGPPLAGEIIDRASYGVAIVVAMVLSLAAAAVLLALPHRR
jgi:MFS family permease